MAREPTAQAGGDVLLERERELSVLRGALDRLLEGRGSMLMVEGAAGVGKTRLLAEAADLGRERPIAVRAARAGQLEREMPFGVARQLLEPLVERAGEAERSRLLSGSAGLSLIAFGQADPAGPNAEVDRFAPIHGLYWLLANLCDSEPVMLVIDDAHWADSQSLRWLDYLARRAHDTPVLIVVGARTGEADEPAELAPLRLEAGEVLRPSPLSGAAVKELIAAELGGAPADEFSDACNRATGGNPFLLTEVLRTLRTQSVDPDEKAAESLAALGAEPVARSVLPRLHGFGAQATSFAQAIAVLGGAPQLRHAAKLAGVGEDRARELCDRLRDAEILAPGHPIDFVHPLIRTAIYLELSEERRSEAHRRVAELLSATGSDARDVAPHLLACAPNGDQWVVGQLRDAAREAMGAGAPDAARRYLERALEEPPQAEVEITYELGRALWGVSPIEAPEVLGTVAERADDPELQLQALEDTAWTYFDSGNLEQAVIWLERFVKALPPKSNEQALAAEASLFCMTIMKRGRIGEQSAGVGAVAQRPAAGAPEELLARQALSFERCLAGAPVEEVVALAEGFSPLPWAGHGPVPAIACKVLNWSGRWEAAREATAWGWETARSTGLVHVASYRESFLAESDRLAGRLIESEAEARTAWNSVCDLAPVSLPALVAVSNLLATLIARGQLDEASELADQWELSAPFSVIPLSPVLLEIRGSLRLARGELESGSEDLLAVGEDLEQMDIFNPAAVPWRQEVVPALGALDRTAEARRLIVEGERRARAFGAPHVIGVILRARASIEPKARAIKSLEASIAALEQFGPPHELARSSLELGAVLRRDGQRRESREPLRRALEIARLSGADAIAGQAGEELAAAGSRPRNVLRTGVDALTASELRTAKLAAEGLGNVEIAQRLFVTRKTVEKHLGNAYTKLEIGSRNAVARRAGRILGERAGRGSARARPQVIPSKESTP